MVIIESAVMIEIRQKMICWIAKVNERRRRFEPELRASLGLRFAPAKRIITPLNQLKSNAQQLHVTFCAVVKEVSHS